MMRVVLKIAAVVLLLPVSVLPANSQPSPGRITGTVVDALGLPMAGVSVSLAGDSSAGTTTTGPDGRFTFDEVLPGEYRVSASGSSLRDAIRTVEVTPGASPDVVIEMQLAFPETVIVTASRSEQSLIMAPSSVTVIGSEAIDASAADNFADLLRGVPGLNVTQFGARDVNVNTRSSTGILANSMLVMVDGRSFFQPLYGAVYWDLMTVTRDEIDQIEVLRTPASALWGSNALNGVINVRTKSPRQMPGLRGSLGFGERGTKTAAVTWADSNDGLSYKLSGSYFEQDAWDRDNTLPDGSPMPPTTVFQNRGTRQPKFDARLDWDGSRGRVWSIRGGLAGANGLLHSALGPVEFASGSYASYVELDHRGDGLDAKVYWNRLDAPFSLVLFGLDEDATNDTFVGEATQRLAAGDRHDLMVGGSVRVDRFDITIAPQDTRRFDAAVFAEDTIDAGPHLNVVVGGRVDKFDTTKAVFAPRLGVIVSPVPAHSFRLTYNRAYRAPSLLENFVEVTLPTFVPLDPPFFFTQLSLGSTDLEMEEQDAVEIGYTGVVNARTTVFATVYNQRIKNNIWFLPVSFYGPEAPPPGWPLDPSLVPPLARVFSFVNLGRVRNRGVELATYIEWPRILLQGSYTFQDVPDLESGTTLPLEINRPPRHQAGGGMTFTSDRWTVGGDVQYSDRAFWADVFTEPFWGHTDAYVSVSARAAYRLPNQPWELWLTAANVLDEDIQSHVFGDIIGRKVTGGVRWQWTP